MAFTVKADLPVARPTVGGGRGRRRTDESWQELLHLVDETITLPKSEAMPLLVPEGEYEGLVKALRKAGNEREVTIRFKTFPVLSDEDEQPVHDENGKPVVTYAEPAGKGQVRVTFWTTRKIYRSRS